MAMQRVHLILYVRDQARSEAFYAAVLGRPPVLSVPGMSEFALAGGAVLGLMPERGIVRLLGAAIVDPALGAGAPRAELYLVDEEARAMHARALAAGARELSAWSRRDWGNEVAYVADPDGHVLAFALRGELPSC